MVRPLNKTEDLLLSLTKNCETFFKQTHTKTQETLELKINKPRETFSIKPPIPIEGCWMIRLTSFEVYKSSSNKTEGKNFELCIDTFDVFSFRELKDELEEILRILDITPRDLQHEILGPRNIKPSKDLGMEKSSMDDYLILLMGYARSPNRDFESYLTIVVSLDEDDIQLISKQHISLLSTMENLQAFIQVKINQRLCTPKVILKGLYKLNMMMLA